MASILSLSFLMPLVTAIKSVNSLTFVCLGDVGSLKRAEIFLIILKGVGNTFPPRSVVGGEL